MTREQWGELLIKVSTQSTKVIEWSASSSKTIAYFARIDGNKPLLVQFCVGGKNAGELATAFIPNSAQLGEIYRLLSLLGTP